MLVNFLRWLHAQSWRCDAVGDLAQMLTGWAGAWNDAIVWGPSDINEAQELVAWALACLGVGDDRECQIRFGSAMYRARHEWRLELTGQHAHTPDQARACRR